MKVIFLQHIVNVWKLGEIKDVTDAYARNFLFPKKLAKQLTKVDIINLENKKNKEEKNRILKVNHRHELLEKLNWKNFNFTLNSSSNWKSFWSIWEKEIIEALKNEFRIDFVKSEIVMNDWHLKKAWKHDVFVKLGSWEMAKLTINIK